ncbi:MAG TPA: hypothetical protein V6C86_00355 [Oculatellaceae cyanobacterium]
MKRLKAQNHVDDPCDLSETRSDRNSLAERHIRKLQKIYSSRRSSLHYSLKKFFGQRVAIQGETSSTYSFVTFLDWDETEILQAAQRSSLPATSIASYYAEDAPHGEFIIDFSCMDEKQMGTIVSQFSGHLRRLGS